MYHLSCAPTGLFRFRFIQVIVGSHLIGRTIHGFGISEGEMGGEGEMGEGGEMGGEKGARRYLM